MRETSMNLACIYEIAYKTISCQDFLALFHEITLRAKPANGFEDAAEVAIAKKRQQVEELYRLIRNSL